MECNRDEAVRAKQIAEKKFVANDISGAKKFALKAQNLFPELEGISQMIATLDVHLSAENKVSGQLDYYSILGVNPEANHETVRKHYRNLAIMLHPDKNKSVGAEAAFKYVSLAWSLLSDKARKVEYDNKRNADTNKKSNNSGGSSSANPARNGVPYFAKTISNNSKTKIPKSGVPKSASSASSAPPQKPKADSTFWTACHSCKTQYEYLRIYLNHNLLCPNCHEAFLAVETAPPGSGSIRRSFSEHEWNSNHRAAGKNKTGLGRNNGAYGNVDAYGQANFQWTTYSGTDNTSYSAQGTRKKNSKRMNGVSSATNPTTKRKKGLESTGATGRGAGGQNFVGVDDSAPKPNGTNNISYLDIQNRLMKKAMREIQGKLRETNNKTACENASKKRRIEDEDREGGDQNALAGENKADEPNCSDSVIKSSHDNEDLDILEAPTADVIDPDFSNFDRDRTGRAFSDDQVWAAYDDVDGMPRCYAMIHRVLSLDPFKVQISWLTINPSNRFVTWIGTGFAQTCGEFIIGKCATVKSLDYFSHKVKWTKGKQGEICIYPRKGDVWALHKNWCPDWNYLAEAETNQKYEIVEVIEGYTDDFDVTVVPLVKAAGFKAVFHHHLDPREIRTIPRAEFARFSHQIPSHLLTGLESEHSLKGCRELDPAATPLDSLRIIVHGKIEKESIVEEEEEIAEQQRCDLETEGTK